MLKSLLLAVVNFVKTLWQALLDRPDEWTAEQALHLGSSLSNAFGYDLPAASHSTPSRSTPSQLDTENLMQLGENLSHIHPGL